MYARFISVATFIHNLIYALTLQYIHIILQIYNHPPINAHIFEHTLVALLLNSYFNIPMLNNLSSSVHTITKAK